MALDQLRAQPNESAMIGDNENDYAAARGAGLPVILMRYGYLRVPPETLTPDVWLDRFCDLPKAVGELNRARLAPNQALAVAAWHRIVSLLI